LQQVGGAFGFWQRVRIAPALTPLTAPPSHSTLSTTSAGSLAFSFTGPRAKRRPRAYGRKLGLAIFATLSGALAFSLLTHGGRETRSVVSLLQDAQEALAWAGLGIDQVAVSGQRFTSDSDIFNAVDLPHARSLLTFDSAAARARIEELPWIETASISRVFPGSLDIRVTERKPVALWQNDDREYLIDASGRMLSGVKPGSQVNLPRLAGEGAPQQAQALLELMMRYPRIWERFELAERVGQRRWTLHLKDRVTIHLGADREAVAFAALSSPDDLGALLSGHDIIIDLRTQGRITVRRDKRSAGTPIAPATQS
jgi:cell division protein FtsQ